MSESINRNPQAEQMADESMVRTLAAQMDAIWPQEAPLFDGIGLEPGGEVLDIGCGTGELAARLARRFPRIRVHGIDIVASHLELARARTTDLASRVTFACGDAFAVEAPDAHYDLTVCRHMLQSVPDAGRVLAEMVRVTRPGGRVHVLSEDYGMIHFHPGSEDNSSFWHDGPIEFGRVTGTDLRFGLKTPSALRQLGLEAIDMHYVVVDTLRVPRETFRAIWVAWRDGYTDVLSEKSKLTRAEVERHWRQMLEVLDDPDAYAVWHVPVIRGRKPL